MVVSGWDNFDDEVDIVGDKIVVVNGKDVTLNEDGSLPLMAA